MCSAAQENRVCVHKMIALTKRIKYDFMRACDLLSEQDQIWCAVACISGECQPFLRCKLWKSCLFSSFFHSFSYFSSLLQKSAIKRKQIIRLPLDLVYFTRDEAHFGTKFSLNAINDLMTPVFVTTTGQTAYHKQLKFS